MIQRLLDYMNSKDYSEGFFSKKMKVRIGVLILALAFLAVAKVYDNKQQEKYVSLEETAAKVAERERKDPGVDPGPAPDFAFKTFDEKDDKLSAHFGKPIVLSFWATWSNDSQRSLPVMDDTFDKYGEEVDFLMVNLTDGAQDTVTNVKSFLKTGSFGFPVYFDTEHYGELEYNVLSLPLTVFIDRSGNVVDCVLEAMTAEELDSHIAEIVK